VSRNVQAILGQDGSISYYQGFTTDITGRKLMENALRTSEEKYRQLFEYSPISLWEGDFSAVKNRLEFIKTQNITDLRAYLLFRPALVQELAGLVRVLNVNQTTLKLFNAGSKDDLSEGIITIFAGEFYESFVEVLLVIASGGRDFFFEEKHLDLEDRSLDIQIYWSVAPGNEQTYSRVLVSIIDVTQHKQTEEKLLYLSFHDSLTGLYNRAFLEAEMNRLDTQRQMPVSMIMADLNGLKLVNDAYGHAIGDRMLKKTAKILTSSARKEDIISRWGGDEFVILLPQTSQKKANDLCSRIRDKCGKAYIETVPVSLALGCAVKDSSEKSLDSVMKVAEDNMYRLKLSDRQKTYSAILKILLENLKRKSFETEAHTRRMKELALKMAYAMGNLESELGRLELLITLHDIGMIKISREVITKKDSLSPEEWEIVKKHPETGYMIAKTMEEFAHVARDILAHHERWDGAGYPGGLKGKEIPLLARITAIADAFDVMTRGRPYRKALSADEAVQELRKCAGKQFDPDLVDIFCSEVVCKDG